MGAIEDFGLQIYKIQRRKELGIFLGNIASKIGKILLAPGVALALSVEPAYSDSMNHGLELRAQDASACTELGLNSHDEPA